jgi:hypothetical protein
VNCDDAVPAGANVGIWSTDMADKSGALMPLLKFYPCCDDYSTADTLLLFQSNSHYVLLRPTKAARVLLVEVTPGTVEANQPVQVYNIVPPGVMDDATVLKGEHCGNCPTCLLFGCCACCDV